MTTTLTDTDLVEMRQRAESGMGDRLWATRILAGDVLALLADRDQAHAAGAAAERARVVALIEQTRGVWAFHADVYTALNTLLTMVGE